MESKNYVICEILEYPGLYRRVSDRKHVTHTTLYTSYFTACFSCFSSFALPLALFGLASLALSHVFYLSGYFRGFFPILDSGEHVVVKDHARLNSCTVAEMLNLLFAGPGAFLFVNTIRSFIGEITRGKMTDKESLGNKNKI